MKDLKSKWAISHICESIQKVSGIKYSRKDAMRQILKELKLFGLDLMIRDCGSQKATDSRFDNWITRFHVSHRFKTMMSINGYRAGRTY